METNGRRKLRFNGSGSWLKWVWKLFHWPIRSGLPTPEQVHALTETLISELSLHRIRRASAFPPGKQLLKTGGGVSVPDAGVSTEPLNGIGGCPMAGDELVGNMDSLLMMDYFQKEKRLPELNEQALEQKQSIMASEIFLNH